MSVSSNRAFRATAIAGFLAVALGALGAHGLKEFFTHRPEAQTWWEKAVLYQFVHVAVMLILTYVEPFPLGTWLLFGGGILFFSGSLYLLAMIDLHWLFYLTPLGGLLLLAGWLSLALARQANITTPLR